MTALAILLAYLAGLVSLYLLQVFREGWALAVTIGMVVACVILTNWDGAVALLRGLL